MTETTQEERDELREMTSTFGDTKAAPISTRLLRRFLNDANRLQHIESRCLLRSEVDAPEWASAWQKSRNGKYCWWIGLDIAREVGDKGIPTPQVAPDVRPDAPPGTTLPIIEDT